MSLTLLDWRRQIAALYAQVRACPSPEQAHALWREGRDRLFARHPESPLTPESRTSFTGLPVAAYDPGLRFVARLDTAVEPLGWEAATGTDGLVRFDRIGRVHLAGLGALDVWWLGSYGGGVFLPVKDALAGRDTYGGGRYLLDTVKGADLGGSTVDGEMVVDLNFAYNPSCAYDPAWACPLAPTGNVLPAELPVGEMAPRPVSA